MERREGTGPVMEVNVLPCHLLNRSCGGTIGCQSPERGYFPCKPPPQRAAQGTDPTASAQRRQDTRHVAPGETLLFLPLGSSKPPAKDLLH